MGKIWLDVTTILGWHRPAVGIVRVEAECARFALSELSSTVEFCQYDPSRGYITVSSKIVQEAIEKISLGNNIIDTRQAMLPSAVKPSAEVRLGALARGLTGRLPKQFRDRTFRYLSTKREAVSASINALRELRRAWRSLRSTSSSTPQSQTIKMFDSLTSPFSEGDVYISLGLDWDQKDIPFIFSERQKLKFKTIFCCYDIIPIKFPQLCVGDVSAKFALYFTDIAWTADEVVCISEKSKDDLLTLLTEIGAPVPKATVFKLGSQIALPDGRKATEETKVAAGDRFILFVSTIERRKNHETLYRAYTRL
ncbi:MAG: hypothetical protein QHC89_02690, partial [Bosea sp. (in: a-proteobacteria)]|nr:hypothetical protein [Bosea sp. (in: a-proteobacteria)]